MTSKVNEQVAVSINSGGNGSKEGAATEPASTFGKLYTRLEEALEEHSPGGIHPEDMKKLGILVPMTVLYIFVFLGALLYFSIQGAYTIQGQQFLSANEQDGSICATVASYITAIFEADLNGVWSTDSANFQTNSFILLNWVYRGCCRRNCVYKEHEEFSGQTHRSWSEGCSSRRDVHPPYHVHLAMAIP